MFVGIDCEPVDEMCPLVFEIFDVFEVAEELELGFELGVLGAERCGEPCG